MAEEPLIPIETMFGAAQNPGAYHKYSGTQHDTIGIGRLPHLPEGANIREVIFDFASKAARAVEDLAPVSDAGAKKIDRQPDRKSETTLTAVAITPDGKITHATLGDSPLIAFVVDKDNKVISAELLNKLDNSNPWDISKMDSTLIPDHVREKLEDLENGKGWGEHKVNDLLGDRGQRLIIVPASDGLIDGVSNAQPHLIALDGEDWNKRESLYAALPQAIKAKVDEAGTQELQRNTDAVLDYLGQHVKAVLDRGGNAQEIADELANAQQRTFSHKPRYRDAEGNPTGDPVCVGEDERNVFARDNTSCNVIIVERGKIPDVPIITMAADGSSTTGAPAAQAALTSFEAISGIEVISAMRNNDPHDKLGTGHIRTQSRVVPGQESTVASEVKTKTWRDFPEKLADWQDIYTIPFTAEDLPILRARVENAGYRATNVNGSYVPGLIIDSDQHNCRAVIDIYPTLPERSNIEFIQPGGHDRTNIPEDLRVLIFAAAEEKRTTGRLKREDKDREQQPDAFEDALLVASGAAQNTGTKYADATGNSQYDSIGAGYLPPDGNVITTIQEVCQSAAGEITALPPINTPEGPRRQASTFTAVGITPTTEKDANIDSATLGDTVAIGFVIGKDNTVLRTVMLNEPDNSDPWETNKISSHLSSKHYQDRLQDPNGAGWKHHTLQGLLGSDGKRLLVVTASDGLLEGSFRARNGTTRSVAERQMRIQTEAALNELSAHVNTALARGDSTQEITNQLVNAEVSFFKHDEHNKLQNYGKLSGRDNTSAAAYMLDPNALPTQPVITMVADGVSDHSIDAAPAALDAFKNHPNITATHAMRNNASDVGHAGTGHTGKQNRGAGAASTATGQPPEDMDIPDTVIHFPSLPESDIQRGSYYHLPFSGNDLSILKDRFESAGYKVQANASGAMLIECKDPKDNINAIITADPYNPGQSIVEYSMASHGTTPNIPDDITQRLRAAAKEKTEQGFLASATQTSHGGGYSGGGGSGATSRQSGNISTGELLTAGGVAAATSLTAYLSHRQSQSQPKENGRKSKFSTFTKCAITVGAILTAGLLASALSGGKISEKIRR